MIEINGIEFFGQFYPKLTKRQERFVAQATTDFLEQFRNVSVNIDWSIHQRNPEDLPLKMVKPYSLPHEDNGEPITLTARITPATRSLVTITETIIISLLLRYWDFESIKFKEEDMQVSLHIRIPLTLRQKLFRVKHRILKSYYRRTKE